MNDELEGGDMFVNHQGSPALDGDDYGYAEDNAIGDQIMFPTDQGMSMPGRQGPGMDPDIFFTNVNEQQGNGIYDQGVNPSNGMHGMDRGIPMQATPASNRQLDMSSEDIGEFIGVQDRIGNNGLPDSVVPGHMRDMDMLQSVTEELIQQRWKNFDPAIVFVTEARRVLAPHSMPADDPDHEFDTELEEVLMEVMIRKAGGGGAANSREACMRATSARMMNYIRTSITESLISQRIALKVLVQSPTWQDMSTYSVPLRRDLAGLIAEILPWYDVSGKNSDAIRAECRDLLDAIALILQQGQQIPSLVRETLQALSHPRVIALARCAGRRVPASWANVMSAMQDVRSSSAAQTSLNTTLIKYNVGLYSTFDHPDYARLMKRARVRSAGSDLSAPNEPLSRQELQQLSTQVLGREVTVALDTLWNEKESTAGDWQALVDLEKTAEMVGLVGADTSVIEKVRTCELIVYNLALSASTAQGMERRQTWGGMWRLLRLIRDALPQVDAGVVEQVRNSVSNEFASLVVACGVVGCCAVVLGLNKEERQGPEGDDAVECSLGLRGFALAHLQDVLKSDDTQEWKPFGAWLLLLASRCGNLLRATSSYVEPVQGGEHVRCAKALRDWSLFGGNTVNLSKTSGSPSRSNDSVASMVMESAMRVIDASDTTGSDEALLELCADLIM